MNQQVMQVIFSNIYNEVSNKRTVNSYLHYIWCIIFVLNGTINLSLNLARQKQKHKHKHRVGKNTL